MALDATGLTNIILAKLDLGSVAGLGRIAKIGIETRMGLLAAALVEYLNANLASASGNIVFEVSEGLTTELPANTVHALPESKVYTLGEGKNLDVYVNGLLQYHGSNADYVEVSSTQIKFTYTLSAGTTLIYRGFI